MKKIVALVGLVSIMFGSDKLLSQKELDEVLKSSFIYPKLVQDIKKGNIEVRGVKKDGFYIINIKTKRGNGNIYITEDKKYTIIGNVIENKTQKPLTAKFPINEEIVKEGVSFTFGKGDKEIYLITDPECPYCKMLEKEKREILENNYKVHVILFPLSFHKDAKAMSYYILSGKDDKEKSQRLQEVLKGSNEWKNYKPTKEEKEKLDNILNKAKKAVEEIGAMGTPTIYDKDFNKINWPTLGDKK